MENEEKKWENSSDASAIISTTGTDENLVRPLFGRKPLKRRSSLFFKEPKETHFHVDDMLQRSDKSEVDKEVTEKTVARRMSGRGRRKTRRRKTKKRKSRYEVWIGQVICSPPPAGLHSVLKNMNLVGLSSDVNKNLVRKKVRFVDVPVVYEITPRPDKIPGVIKMPDSPPSEKVAAQNTCKSVNSEVEACSGEIQENCCHIAADQDQLNGSKDLESICVPKSNDSEGTMNLLADVCVEDRNREASSVANTAVVVLSSTVSSNDKVIIGEKVAVPKMLRKRSRSEVYRSNISQWIRGERLRKRGYLSLKNDQIIESAITCQNATKKNEEEICTRSEGPVCLPRSGADERVEKWLKFHFGKVEEIVKGGQKVGTSANVERLGMENEKYSKKPIAATLNAEDIENMSCDKRESLNAFEILMRTSPLSQKKELQRRLSRIDETARGKSGSRKRSLQSDKSPVPRRKPPLLSHEPQSATDKCSTNDKSTCDDELEIVGEVQLNVIEQSSKSPKIASAESVCSACDFKKAAKDNEALSFTVRKRAHLREYDHAPFSSIGHVGYETCEAVACESPLTFRLPRTNSDDTVSQEKFLLRRRSCYENPSTSHFSGNTGVASSVKDEENRKLAWKKRIANLATELGENLWMEALRPKSTDELIIRDDDALNQIQKWLQKWKSELAFSAKDERKGRSKSGVGRKEKKQAYSDDESIPEYESHLCNTLVLSGPCGSGKTTMIYALAADLEMRVIEVASNERRNGSTIRSKLQGATQTRQLLITETVDKILMQKAGSTWDAFTVEESVILIDDVDVVFKDDEYFWSAVNHLRQMTLTPIVLICNDIDLIKCSLSPNNEFVSVVLRRPSVQEVSSYLQEVVCGMGLSISLEHCTTIAQTFKGDLRACINYLHFRLLGRKYSVYSLEGMEDIQELSSDLFFTWRRNCRLAYNVAVRPNYSSVESNNDYDEDHVLNFDGSDCPVDHVVTKTRRVLSNNKYIPIKAIAIDYVPYLSIIDRASSARQISRRKIHYFDDVCSGTPIDSSGELKCLIKNYRFSNF